MDPQGSLSSTSGSTQNHPKPNPMSKSVVQILLELQHFGAVTTALGILFYAHYPSEKGFFLTPNLTLPWCSSMPLPQVLLLSQRSCRPLWGLPLSFSALGWTKQFSSSPLIFSSLYILLKHQLMRDPPQFDLIFSFLITLHLSLFSLIIRNKM